MKALFGKLMKMFMEWSPMDNETDRRLFRFAVALLIAVPIVLIFFSTKDLMVLLYKIVLPIVGFLLADLVWTVSPYFRRFEEATDARVVGVFIFRGLVYFGFIVAVSHGL